MQIVIDIPKEMYQTIKETSSVISGRRSGKRIDYTLFNAVYNGIPLSKGHGRLIDAKDVGEYLTLADVPTIIEADDKEDNNEDSN